MAVLLLAGLLISGTGYRHGLPYIDYPDEMTIWTMGRATIDPTWPMFQPQYPPGLLFVSATIQRLQEAAGTGYPDPSGTVGIMRLTSVFAYCVTLLLIMLAGYRMAGIVASLVAGVCWIVLPLANAQAKLATIDAWVCMWFMASVVTGVEGWMRRSAGWIASSLILAIIATLFKWQAAAALGVAGLAYLSLWKSNRRLMIVLMAGYVVIVGLFSYWVVFVHKALEGGVYLPGTQTNAPTLASLLINLNFQVTQTGSALVFGVLPIIGLILAAVLPEARRELLYRSMLWSFPLIIIAFNAIIAFNGAPVFARHYLAANGLLAIGTGIAITLILDATQKFAVRWKLPSRAVMAVTTLILIAALAVPMLDMLRETFAMNVELSRPDRRTVFAAWASATATDGALLITDPTVDAALQTLYGYQGRPLERPYNQGTSVYVREEQITPELLAARGIRYIVTSPGFDVQRLGVPITRLIAYGGDEVYRGTPWGAFYVGDLPPLHTDTPTVFSGGGDEVQLVGESISKSAVCRGESAEMRLVWRALGTPTRYYSMFVHFADAQQGELSLPINGQPPAMEARPTLTWSRPDELLVSPTSTLTIPADLVAGSYEVWLGLYEPVSGDHLLLPDGKHYVRLWTLEVRSC